MLEGRSEARPATAVDLARFLRTLPLALATRLALAATLFFVVCGSSSVHELVRIGSPLRWVSLAVFTALALLWAAAEGAAASDALRVGGGGLLLSALGFVSASWSIAPLYTLERGSAFAFVAVGAAAVGAAVAARRDEVEALGETIVVTVLLVCLAGVVVYAADPTMAAVPGHAGTGFRFSGLGESPNTIPMLSTLAAFLAAWLAFVRRGARRIVHTASFVAFFAEIAASGSRGAVIALVAGALLFAFAAPVAGASRRVALVALALAVGGSGIVANRLIQDLTQAPVSPAASASSKSAEPAPFPRLVLPTFANELGTIPVGGRAFIGKDGRATVLQEAFDQGSERPILGFGFGTEVRAFIKRVAQFQSNRVEDSYLGLYLELGGVGVVVWLLVGAGSVWSLVRGRRLARRERFALAGLVAAVVAGFGLAIGESYIYAAGNVATLTLWTVVAVSSALVVSSRVGIPRPALALAGLALVATVPLGVWENGQAQAAQNAGMRSVWERLGSRLTTPTLDGFRRDPPRSCLLYDAGGSPGGYELCFQGGRLVEAIDRRDGRFSAWTVQQWGPQAATLHVDPKAVEATLRRLGAYAPDVAPGFGYQTRQVG